MEGELKNWKEQELTFQLTEIFGTKGVHTLERERERNRHNLGDTVIAQTA